MKLSRHIAISIVAVLLLAVFVLRGQQDQQTAVAAGPFQLFQGRYGAGADETAITVESVFRIDTKTGRTWTYVTGTSSGKFYSRWLLIEE